tara:strand:+ start:1256 stop:1630 length:375 start_codon:yes stop_codon:yes gene_type:complete
LSKITKHTKIDLIYKIMSRFKNRRWLVIPTSIIDTINFNEVQESSVDSLRKSIDESETFVKYDISVIEETITQTHKDTETNEDVEYTVEAGTYGRPSIYSDEYTEYNHEDILALLATSAWTNPE